MIIIILLIGTEFAIPSTHTYAESGQINFGLSIFFVPRTFHLDSGVAVQVHYVIAPYLAIFLIGILLGPIIHSGRYYMVIGLSITFLGIFLFLRLMWFYDIFDFGNIRDKSSTGNNYYNFFGLCKYPPSITFVMWTLGLDLFILYVIKKFLMARLEGTFLSKLLLLYGQCSLFFYLIQFTVIALLALPFPEGVSRVGYVYLILINFFIVISPICYVFQEYKNKLPHNSILRMF